MTKVFQIMPFLHVPDLRDALAFFRDVLGFGLKFHEADHATVQFQVRLPDGDWLTFGAASKSS